MQPAPATTDDTSTREERLAKASRIFTVITYDPEIHGAFVRSTFALGALRSDTWQARKRFDDLIGEPESRTILAHTNGNPKLLAGWAARAKDALVFAYVLPAVRGRAIANLLMRELGLEGLSPLPLMHWTPTAQSIAAAKGRVYFAPRWHLIPPWHFYIRPEGSS